MSVQHHPPGRRALAAVRQRPGTGPMPVAGGHLALGRRLAAIRGRVDRLRHRVQADEDDRTLLRECASVRWALEATEDTWRREQAARRVLEALEAGGMARRAREEPVDLVLPRSGG